MISADVIELVIGFPEPVLLVSKTGDIIASNNKANVLLCGTHTIAGNLQEHIAESSTRLRHYLLTCSRTKEPVPGAFSFQIQPGLRWRFEGNRISLGSNGASPLVWLRILPHEQANSRFLLLNERILQLAKEVHARSRAEGALRTRTAEFETLLNQAPLGIYLVDSDLRIRQINPTALAVFGIPDVIGRSLDDVLHLMWPRKFADQLIDRFRHTLATGETYLVTEHLEQRRDRREWECYEWQVNRIPLDENRFGLVCYFRDIAARKQAEEALMRSEKLATAGRLASSIAHEINNPLESVTNLLYLARNNVEPGSETHHYLLTADQELSRVAHLARQTLGFYRDSSAPVWFKAPEVIESVISLYARKLENKQVEIFKKFPDQSGIFALSGEFRQVLSNLIVNALDAMPKKDARLAIRAFPSREWTETGAKGIRIIVADNGSGIHQDSIHKIFEPFFTTKESTGTGLGLWLSNQIVQKHGGWINVRSCVVPHRCGTVFSIFWPYQPRKMPTRGKV